MKEIKFYVADDGTKFDTASECLKYEDRLYPDRPIMLDWEGDQTTDYDCAYYVIVRNPKEGKYALQRMLHDSNLTEEFKKDLKIKADDLIGIWKYDDCERVYLCVSEQDIDHLNKALQFYHDK